MTTTTAYSPRIFSIVTQMFRANRDQVSLTSDDGVRHLTRLIAEQIAHELKDDNWGYDPAGLILYRNGNESFTVDWIKNGSVRFPLVKGEMGEHVSFFPVAGVDHFAPAPEAPIVAAMPMPEYDTVAELTMLKLKAERLSSTLESLTEIMGLMSEELQVIREKQDRSYTARLNFKTVTFHPVDRDSRK